MLNVPLLHGYCTDPSALFSGGVRRSPTFTLPTTTHFKNMRSFCATLYMVITRTSLQTKYEVNLFVHKTKLYFELITDLTFRNLSY
jgi:hypothetical protein